MFNYKILSDIGVVRSENQDRAAVFYNEKNKSTLAVVCDGMGGHKGGSIASSITVKTFGEEFISSLPELKDKWPQWFKSVLDLSKRKMVDYASEESSLLDMGTTITAAIIWKDIIYVFNVGDSRTYVYNGLLHQTTTDHNLRNYYIKNLNLSPEKAATVKGATALTSALGPTKVTSLDYFLLTKTPETKYVILTSDGIHDYISKPLFEQIVSRDSSLQEKTNSLVKNAIKGKSADNLTVVILEIT